MGRFPGISAQRRWSTLGPQLNMRILSLIALSVFVIAPGLAGDDGYLQSISVRTLLRTSVDAAGQPIRYPSQKEAEVYGVLVDIPAGQNTGWHTHPCPCVAYVLEGKVTVEAANGVVKELKAGDVFSEVVNLAHCGYNRSAKRVRILMVVIGEKGTAISKRAER